MVVVLAAMALLAVYSNVQKLRRARNESVSIMPAAPVDASAPSPSPTRP